MASKIKKEDYQSLADCIRSDQVPANHITEYFEEKDFNGDVDKLVEHVGKKVRTMPQIKIDDVLVGGYNQLVEYFVEQGKVNFKGEIISE